MIAGAIVAGAAIWFPTYRWFLLISIGIGVAVAGLGGEIVPIQCFARLRAARVRGLLTVIEPSGSMILPPPYDISHSSALQVNPSYEAPCQT